MQKILTWLKKENVNVALLQETHFTVTDVEHDKLKREWVEQIYCSSFSSSKRVVAILVNKNTPFILKKCSKDPQGRFILITGLMFGEDIQIGCVYTSNTYSSELYSKFLAKASTMKTTFNILSGDFNCTMDPEADQNPPRIILLR